jgi:hypothetical protein
MVRRVDEYDLAVTLEARKLERPAPKAATDRLADVKTIIKTMIEVMLDVLRS